MATHQALERQYEIYKQTQSFERRMFNRFLDNLTPRQETAFKLRGTVPKSKDHQRRYRDWQLAKAELDVERSRSRFELIQGARAI